MCNLNLQDEINRLRKKLIDRSRHNDLINFDKPKGRSLQIVDRSPAGIFEHLVLEKKPLTLIYAPEEPEVSGEISESEVNSRHQKITSKSKETVTSENRIITAELEAENKNQANKKEKKKKKSVVQFKDELLLTENTDNNILKNEVQTKLAKDELDTLLLKIRRMSKSFIEETGVNQLHLSLGFLSWTSNDDNDEKQQLSPLILIPISIQETDRNGEKCFTVSWTEDDITGNLGLIDRLDQDFQLKIDDFDIEDPEEEKEIDVEAYFKSVKELTLRHHPDWILKREACIGFFSFQKLSMYKDLDPQNWNYNSDEPSIRNTHGIIFGAAREEHQANISQYADDYSIDAHSTAKDVSLPLDADSSQHSALCDIHEGKNLVIEGPPGTGKSQTIANAIANAIASGKTVLFVAEKLTALQVVYERLADIGLGDFCLQLHSQKASPKSVYESLRKRIERKFRRKGDIDKCRIQLERQKSRLNKYVEKMAEKRSPYNESLNKMIWRAISLRNKGASPITGKSTLSKIDSLEFRQCIEELHNLEEQLVKIPHPMQSPLWGYSPSTFADYQNSEDLKNNISLLGQNLESFNSASDNIQALCNSAQAPSLNYVKKLGEEINFSDFIQRTPSLNAMQLASLAKNPDEAKALLDAREENLQSQQKTEKLINQKINPVGNDLLELSKELSFIPETDTNASIINSLMSWEAEFVGLSSKISGAAKSLESLKIPFPETYLDIQKALGVVQLAVNKRPENYTSICKQMFSNESNNIFQNAKSEAESIQSQYIERRKEQENIEKDTPISWPIVFEEIPALKKTTAVLSKCFDSGTDLASLEPQCEWAETANRCLNDVDTIIAGAESFLPSKIDTLQNALKAFQVLIGMHDASISDTSQITEAYFSDEIQQLYAEAKKHCDEIYETKQELESFFEIQHAPSPEKIQLLAKALRRHYGTWLRTFSSEYRSAKQALKEFSKIDTKHSDAEWIEALDTLATFEETTSLFTDQYKIDLGSIFTGLRTDWSHLEKAIEWSNIMRRLGMTCSSVHDLLLKQKNLLSKFPEHRLRSLFTKVKKVFEIDLLVRPSSFDYTNIKELELNELKRELASYYQNLSELLKSKQTIGLNNEITLRDVIRIIELAEKLQSLQNVSDIRAQENAFLNNTKYRECFEENFVGTRTDWDSLEELVDWSHNMQQSGIPYEKAQEIAKNKDEIAKFDYENNLALAYDYKSILEKIPKEFETLLTNKLESLSFAEALHCINVISTKFETILKTLTHCGLTSVSFNELHKLLHSVVNWRESENALSQCLTNTSFSTELQNEILSHPEKTRRATEWLRDLKEHFGSQDIALQLIDESPKLNLEKLSESVDSFIDSHKKIRSIYASIKASHNIEEDWIGISLQQIRSGEALERVKAIAEAFPSLTDWIDLFLAQNRCTDLGLGKYCNAAFRNKIQHCLLSDTFELTQLDKNIRDAFEGAQELQVSEASLNQIRKKFKEYDKELLQLNQNEIACRASQRQCLPGVQQGRVGEFTELGLIRHEINKTKRFIKIRQLIKRAGTSTQAFKPCFMMSPLTVSRFIAPNSIKFDVVIMDEASQIKPEDALGSILRADQLVVVGDPKQLPPTTVGERLDEEIPENEAVAADNSESILEVAMKAFQPFRRLRWHYRSRHESLIRFSNNRFYDNDLIIFPSPNVDASSFGVSNVFVEDATWESKRNMKEAEAVVDAIIDHALHHPTESLGVATFNARQAELIEELLDKRCAEDGLTKEVVNKLRDHEDELFIKNLERVQGDERDVMFICYTYGKDPESQRVYQRFGPITTKKGWRRINVLITRARQRMVVFHSFQPTDIQGGPEKSLGVNAYKDFLDYAITGKLREYGIVNPDRPPDSPFEESVARVITQMGLEAVPQYGVAGYFIDIVIREPGGEHFFLGVECDGATYHSGRSATDRDRLREENICSKGWELHRIWSTSWFNSQEQEEEKLRSVIKKAREKHNV